jgi:hypothetical protein
MGIKAQLTEPPFSAPPRAAAPPPGTELTEFYLPATLGNALALVRERSGAGASPWA